MSELQTVIKSIAEKTGVEVRESHFYTSKIDGEEHLRWQFYDADRSLHPWQWLPGHHGTLQLEDVGLVLGWLSKAGPIRYLPEWTSDGPAITELKWFDTGRGEFGWKERDQWVADTLNAALVASLLALPIDEKDGAG